MHKRLPRSAWISIFNAAFASAFLCLAPALGDIFAGPSEQTMRTLNTWHYFLEIFKDRKGGYPKTLKEIKSFRKDVPMQDCYEGKVLCQSRMIYVDGWKTPFEYKSDGKTYRVTGSHGFFLTEKTTVKGIQKEYWDNSGTPPIDPPPPKDTI